MSVGEESFFSANVASSCTLSSWVTNGDIPLVKNGLGHFLFHCSPIASQAIRVYKWTDGLLMSLPTSCMPIFLLDLNDRLGQPRAEEPHDLIGTVGAGVEGDSATRFRALLRRHSIAVPHTRFIWLHPHFMFRADDHESILLPHTLLCNSRVFCTFHGW